MPCLSLALLLLSSENRLFIPSFGLWTALLAVDILAPSFSLSHTHTHTLSLSLSYTHSFSFFLSLSTLSFSLSVSSFLPLHHLSLTDVMPRRKPSQPTPGATAAHVGIGSPQGFAALPPYSPRRPTDAMFETAFLRAKQQLVSTSSYSLSLSLVLSLRSPLLLSLPFLVSVYNLRACLSLWNFAVCKTTVENERKDSPSFLLRKTFPLIPTAETQHTYHTLH